MKSLLLYGLFIIDIDILTFIKGSKGDLYIYIPENSAKMGPFTLFEAIFVRFLPNTCHLGGF